MLSQRLHYDFDAKRKLVAIFTQYPGSFNQLQGRVPWMCEPSSKCQILLCVLPCLCGYTSHLSSQPRWCSNKLKIPNKHSQNPKPNPPPTTKMPTHRKKILAAGETDPSASKNLLRIKTQEVSCKWQEMNTAAIWCVCVGVVKQKVLFIGHFSKWRQGWGQSVHPVAPFTQRNKQLGKNFLLNQKLLNCTVKVMCK